MKRRAAGGRTTASSSTGNGTRSDAVIPACLDLLGRYPQVITEISPRDHMYASGRERYFDFGKMALDVIRHAFLLAGKHRPERILDLPSGHGRVLRTLKAEYPDAQLTACDIDRDAVEFCAKTFGAVPVYSRENPREIVLGGTFDLIWCGSLLTHLHESLWDPFLDLFENALDIGGILVVTVSGRAIADILRDPVAGEMYMAPAARRKAILKAYGRDGFGYADYAFADDVRESLSLPRSFGISLSEPSFVCSRLGRRRRLRLLSYSEVAWGNQDAFACVRVE